jgi:hypothetical protein
VYLTLQIGVDKTPHADFMKSIKNLSALKKQLESAQNFDKVAQLKQISEFNKTASIKEGAGYFSEKENGDYVSIPTLEGSMGVQT